MPFPIHERRLRVRLETRSKPYFIRVADGLHVGYRKGKSISRWVVRRVRDGRYRTYTLCGVEPDDRVSPDGVRVLDFHQVVDQLMNESKGKLNCSFCGKPHTQVGKLIAGPSVYICDACIALCQIYLDHPSEQGRLVVEDGRAAMLDGKPVFVPLSPSEKNRIRDLLR